MKVDGNVILSVQMKNKGGREQEKKEMWQRAGERDVAESRRKRCGREQEKKEMWQRIGEERDVAENRRRKRCGRE